MTELQLRRLLQTIFNSVCAGICCGFLILAVMSEGLRWWLWTMFGPACTAGVILLIVLSIYGFMMDNARQIKHLEKDYEEKTS